MAKRPIFLPANEIEHLVDEIQVEFKWNPGFAVVQKKKNIKAMHKEAKKKGFFLYWKFQLSLSIYSVKDLVLLV